MMKCQSSFPSKRCLLRFLHPDVACRSSSTAAAVREVPTADNHRSGKRITKQERKRLVEAYVNKYRVMNAGKFPTANDTRKQVGGSYYIVRAILQELEYNSKLPTVAAKDKNPMEKQIDKMYDVSEVGEVLVSQVPVCRTIVSEDYGVSAEDVSNSQEDNCQRMVDMSIVTKNTKVSAEDVHGSQIMVDLELERECEKTSTANVCWGDSDRSVESREVSETSNSLERNPAAEMRKATTIAGHPSEVPGTSRNTELDKTDETSSQASESDQTTKETTTPKIEDNELQKSSMWDNLRSLVSDIVSIWRKG